MTSDPDWVVVDALVDGQRVPDARKCERREAAIVLLNRRRPALELGNETYGVIARQVGLSVRSIERYARALDFPLRDNRKGAEGEMRAKMKDLILANPRMSASRAARILGMNDSAGVAHVARLVADGELPARTEADIDNPRWRGYPAAGVTTGWGRSGW